MCNITQNVNALRWNRKLFITATQSGDHVQAQYHLEMAIRCRINLADLTASGENFYPNPLNK